MRCWAVPLERRCSRKITQCLEIVRISTRRGGRVGSRRPLSASSRADFPVVAIGASAGGLDACKKLLDALPADNGMAFILVQHLDPSHDSMMVGLLAGHTSMPVVAGDRRHGDRTRARLCHSARRLSFRRQRGVADFATAGASRRAPAIRLPVEFVGARIWRARRLRGHVGNRRRRQRRADGGQGERRPRHRSGLGEAEYDGMPRSAIATGAVDLVLPAAKIAEALVEPRAGGGPGVDAEEIAARQFGPGFAARESSICCGRRRFTILPSTSTARSNAASSGGWRWRRSRPRTQYLDFLQRDANELDQLSRDLLINVTGFFRDPAVFDFLAKSAIPDLVRDHAAGSAAAGLGRRLQFRGGDLFPRHAVS